MTVQVRYNEDWKVIANDLISSFVSSTAIEKRASGLIEGMKQADVPSQIILPLMNALSTYSKQTNDDVSNHYDDSDFLYDCILQCLTSSLIDENCSIKIIQFTNFVLLGSSIEEIDEEIGEERSLGDAKLVLYNILMYDNDHQSFSPNFDAIQNPRLQNFWRRMYVSLRSKRNSGNVDKLSDSEAIIAVGDYSAEKIYSGAKYLSNSLTRMVPKVTKGIENLGEYAKQNITPSASREALDQEDQGVAVTQATVEATDTFRKASQTVAIGIRDLSTRGINKAAEKWEENGLGKDICPQDEMREGIVTAGKIGMAAIGATVEIAESVFEATKAVAQSSIKVTADVAQHKYGGNTGEVIENTGTATGNILRGISHVVSLEGQVLGKSVITNTARVNTEEMVKNKSNDVEDINVNKKLN